MSKHIGNGILDGNSGLLIASDEVLSELMGEQSLSELLPELDLSSHCSIHTRLCPVNGEPVVAKVEFTRLDGKERNWLLLRIEQTPSQDVDNQFLDAVTGLPDRRALEPHRSRWVRESSDGQLPHALLFMDLDGFKQINDQFGHAAGDRVLASIARRLRKALRSRDLLVRYGGDEFVALIAGVHSLEESEPIIQRLKKTTSGVIEVDGHSLESGVTIGMALADNVTVPLDELIAAADRAMYAKKGRK